MRIDSRDFRNTPTATNVERKPQVRTGVETPRESSGSLPEVKLTAELVSALAGDPLL